MTKKDYWRIADALRETRDSYAPNWNANLFRALDDAALKLSETLAAENERFNTVRFLDACGYKKDSAWPKSTVAEREARKAAKQ